MPPASLPRPLRTPHSRPRSLTPPASLPEAVPDTAFQVTFPDAAYQAALPVAARVAPEAAPDAATGCRFFRAPSLDAARSRRRARQRRSASPDADSDCISGAAFGRRGSRRLLRVAPLAAFRTCSRQALPDPVTHAVSSAPKLRQFDEGRKHPSDQDTPPGVDTGISPSKGRRLPPLRGGLALSSAPGKGGAGPRLPGAH
jgi:hypothetical protein